MGHGSFPWSWPQYVRHEKACLLVSKENPESSHLLSLFILKMGGEVEVVDDLRSSLIENSSSPEQTLKRTGDSSTAYFFFEKVISFLAWLSIQLFIFIHPKGTQWTALAHIITGVIGAGVLSLAWSVAQLGWILGPVSIIAFAFITVVSTNLVSDCYTYPDPEGGVIQNRSYMEAVKLYLGKKRPKSCSNEALNANICSWSWNSYADQEIRANGLVDFSWMRVYTGPG